MGVGYANDIMMPAQVSFRSAEQKPEGLRSLKKLRTRRAIEDAALALFAVQGYDETTIDQIAEKAEISTTTFFRYFPTKAEVVLAEHGQQLPALHRAIVERPAGESELTAIRWAVLDEWVLVIDAERTAEKARIVATSPLLQGLSFERGYRWLEVMTDALAKRRGLATPDERAMMAARVALGVLASTIEPWIASGCRGDVATAVARGFDLMAALCGTWSESSA
jgi:AcrR family transcriptional regulator